MTFMEFVVILLGIGVLAVICSVGLVPTWVLVVGIVMLLTAAVSVWVA